MPVDDETMRGWGEDIKMQIDEDDVGVGGGGDFVGCWLLEHFLWMSRLRLAQATAVGLLIAAPGLATTGTKGWPLANLLQNTISSRYHHLALPICQ